MYNSNIDLWAGTIINKEVSVVERIRFLSHDPSVDFGPFHGGSQSDVYLDGEVVGRYVPFRTHLAVYMQDGDLEKARAVQAALPSVHLLWMEEVVCYNIRMYNWSVDTTELEKDPEKFAVWRLEQMVNFGASGERISAADLQHYWDRLLLDPAKKRFLGFLLWGKEYLNRVK